MDAPECKSVLLRIRLGVEDGTQYMNAQELINNVTAVCSCVDPVNGLTHTMTWRSDEQDASVLVCEPPEGDVCTSSGTYQVECAWLFPLTCYLCNIPFTLSSTTPM